MMPMLKIYRGVYELPERVYIVPQNMFDVCWDWRGGGIVYPDRRRQNTLIVLFSNLEGVPIEQLTVVLVHSSVYIAPDEGRSVTVSKLIMIA